MKKVSIILGVVAVIALFVGLGYFQKNIAPQQILKVKTRLDVPAQYAFISDSQSDKLAVVDTYSDTVYTYLNLKAIPDLMTISKNEGLLVYSDGQQKSLYVLNLADYSQNIIPIPAVPTQLKFHPDGRILAIASLGQVDLLDLKEQRVVQTLGDYTDNIALNYSMDGHFLFISELSTGRLIQYQPSDNSNITITEANGERLTGVTLTPNGLWALVSQVDSKQLLIYSIIEQKIIERITLQEQPRRPYVSSDSQYILVSNASEVVILDGQSAQLVGKVPMTKPTDFIRSGWLESTAIVSDSKQLLFFDFAQPKASLISQSMVGEIKDMLVMADSKSLLITQSNSNELSIYNIRDKSLKTKIGLELQQPNLIMMGITNTLCH